MSTAKLITAETKIQLPELAKTTKTEGISIEKQGNLRQPNTYY